MEVAVGTGIHLSVVGDLSAGALTNKISPGFFKHRAGAAIVQRDGALFRKSEGNPGVVAGKEIAIVRGVLIGAGERKGKALSRRIFAVIVWTITGSKQFVAVTVGAACLLAGFGGMRLAQVVLTPKGERDRKAKVRQEIACGRCWGEFETDDKKQECQGLLVCEECAKAVGITKA